MKHIEHKEWVSWWRTYADTTSFPILEYSFAFLASWASCNFLA